MGSRGPLPAKRATSTRTADGKLRLRQLPNDADAIFRRLVKDIVGLTAADVMLVEDTARWAAVSKQAYAQLQVEGLTVPDTAHGDGTEMRKNATLIIMRTASEQIRANAQQLGATPLARARLPEQEPEQMTLGQEFMEIARRRRSQAASKDE